MNIAKGNVLDRNAYSYVIRIRQSMNIIGTYMRYTKDIHSPSRIDDFFRCVVQVVPFKVHREIVLKRY